MKAPAVETLNWTRQSRFSRSTLTQTTFSHRKIHQLDVRVSVSFLLSALLQSKALHWEKKKNINRKQQHKLLHRTKHLFLCHCNLFVTSVALYSSLGRHSTPQHLLPRPSLSLSLSLSLPGFFETIWGFARSTKHLFLDCTKEDGGISSCLKKKKKKTSSRRHL